MLFKRSVTLTDAREVFRNSILGSGFAICSCTANGSFIPAGIPLGPQERIWNQYAAMFEFYQVKSLSVRFYPYKYEYTAGAVSG
jgi:hypothetical protein